MTDASASRTVQLTAPLTGILVPIENVPDPVFAQKMVGEGFSIDPLSDVLLAPIDGEVINVQNSQHAVTIRSEDGLEVLLHIGLDTVRLGGEGFRAQVKLGQQVKVGDPLVEFDLDHVATEAKSVLTQVVISNSELVEDFSAESGLVTAGQDVAASLTLATTGDSAGDSAGDGAQAQRPKGKAVVSEALLLPNPNGLHARPAATLVGLARGYDADLRLRRGDDVANAKSIVAIMGLGVARGDKITVSGHGPDAQAAVDAIAQAIKDGLGEDCPPLPAGEPGAAPGAEGAHGAQGEQLAYPEEPAPPRSGDPNLLLGVAASPGLSVGTVVQLRHDDIEVEEFAQDRHKERRKLNAALDRALLDLSALQRRLEEESGADKAAIFAAHQEVLQDPDLLDLASSAIDKGKSAPYAWRGAFRSYAQKLAASPNPVLAERANDIRDVGQRVLEELTGQRADKPELPTGAILIAEELTPSDTAQLDRDKVVGFATTSGGASSHVAIIARSLDIPAIAGIESRALDIEDGARVVLDGGRGRLQLNLDDDQIEQVLVRQERIAQRKAQDDAAKDEPAVTTDGHTVAVQANIGGVADAQEAMTKGAEGVGLLRSEFVFLGRSSAPSEDEQAQVYAECARSLRPGAQLVVRTLDVGGDKPLPYLPIPAEENPFLGMRGIRVGLERPEVLRTQLRAIFRAADAGAALHVMFPMIATIEDWRRAKAIFDEERDASGIEAAVPAGIMMEVPSVAVMAEQFAAEDGCDFFSVGTNDLTSYTLAMDRGHPKLAAQVDPCSPAVLAMIAAAVKALHARGKWLGVCGSLASDPQAVPLLVGLGVDELSCSIPAIPSVKAAVRRYALSHCEEIAAKALTSATPADVRALVPVDED